MNQALFRFESCEYRTLARRPSANCRLVKFSVVPYDPEQKCPKYDNATVLRRALIIFININSPFYILKKQINL